MQTPQLDMLLRTTTPPFPIRLLTRTLMTQTLMILTAPKQIQTLPTPTNEPPAHQLLFSARRLFLISCRQTYPKTRSLVHLRLRTVTLLLMGGRTPLLLPSQRRIQRMMLTRTAK